MRGMTNRQRYDCHIRMDTALEFCQVSESDYQNFQDDLRSAEFDRRLCELIQEFILDPINPFAGEKVTPGSGWNYSADGILTPSEQVAKVHDKLGLMGNFAAKVVDYPKDERADGILAIPFLRDLGTAYDISDPTGDGYGKLGESIWGKVSTARKGKTYNHRKSTLGSNYIRLNAEVSVQLETLETKFPAENRVVHYHAIPINTGSLFAGCSPRNARVSALQSRILPLGFVQVLCIILAWPERLSKNGVRWIDCPADEYNWRPGDSWADCPFVSFNDDTLRLSAGGADSAIVHYGSAVAFPGVYED